jgi:hypothetical protein
LLIVSSAMMSGYRINVLCRKRENRVKLHERKRAGTARSLYIYPFTETV